VEIMEMKKSWQTVVGAVGGALLVVTVYEGRVLLANSAGEVRLEAGESGTAATGQTPYKKGAKVDSQPPEWTVPPKDVSRDELLSRDAVQRTEIAALRQRVRDLESAGPHASGPRRRVDPDGRPWFSPSEETLKSFVKECRVRFDSPPLYDSEPFRFPTQQAAKLNLEPEQLAAVNRVMEGLQKSLHARVQELFIEATGDMRAADTLSASAMQHEIFDKAEPGEMTELRRRVASERAGLVAPPADLSRLSPIERLFRLQIGLGDEAGSALAEVLGKERARDLRATEGGWGMQHEMAGCSKTGDDD
jgi:hypothetical protein